jgi:hypothetical protein
MEKVLDNILFAENKNFFRVRQFSPSQIFQGDIVKIRMVPEPAENANWDLVRKREDICWKNRLTAKLSVMTIAQRSLWKQRFRKNVFAKNH